VSVAGYIDREQSDLPTSRQLDQDDACAAAKSCTYGTGLFGAMRVAQVLARILLQK
jgi:hypothetical protein